MVPVPETKGAKAPSSIPSLLLSLCLSKLCPWPYTNSHRCCWAEQTGQQKNRKPAFVKECLFSNPPSPNMRNYSCNFFTSSSLLASGLAKSLPHILCKKAPLLFMHKMLIRQERLILLGNRSKIARIIRRSHCLSKLVCLMVVES